MNSSPIQLGSRGHSLAAHVEDVIRVRIREGVFAPGSLLPSRRALCTEFGIAPTTLEKAIKSLLADGTLRSEARRGTFVADTLPPSTDRGPASYAAPRRIRETRSPRIGVLSVDNDLISLDPVQSLFDYMILHSVEDRVSSLGGELVYRATQPRQYDPAYLMDGAIDEFLSLDADAVIVIAVHIRIAAAEREVAYASSQGLPTVVISSSARDWSTTHVWTDNRMAGRSVCEHLLELGHNRIAFLAPYDAFWQEDRIQGALDAMRQAGLGEEYLAVVRSPVPISEEVPDHVEAIQAGAALIRSAMENVVPAFTGIIAANDWVAVSAARALTDLGMTSGEDYALVSFDDQAIARQNQISSFRFPLEMLGAEAGTLAIRAASGERLLHRLRIVGRVVTRQSSRRIYVAPTS